MLWHKIAVDLGTTYSLVYTQEDGILLREPTAVAVKRATGEAIAFGQRAREMLGRAPEFIEVIRPLSDGVIADFDAARALLSHFIRAASRRQYLSRKAVIVCIPHGATAVEMEALRREAIAAGAHRIDLIKEPFAAALGAGLPIDKPHGNLVIDIGGGTTEVTSIALNDIVYCESLRMAGNAMDQAVQAYFRQQHAFFIGETTAEQIKMRYGAVYENGDEVFEVKGLNRRTGKPQRLMVRASEIRVALEPIAQQITDAVRRCIERLSPELASDIFSDGAAMVGGGGLLHGWPSRFHDAMGLKIRVSDDPLMCVMRGLIEILQNRDRYETLIQNSRIHPQLLAETSRR
jgi:rod shape-determining protein MreB and related proteins